MRNNDYQNTKSNIVEGIEDEFQYLAGQLKDVDFSKRSNKSYVLNKTLKNIDNKGVNKMNKIKKTGIIAASLIVVSTLVSQTTFAQETVEKILNTLSLGHVTMIEYDGNEPEEAALPDSVKGKVFDKNKTPLEKITKDLFAEGIYTEAGEKIAKIDPKKGTIVTEKQMKEEEDKERNNTLYVTDSSTLNQYTCFNVKLPTYLPEGYTFKNAEFTKDESGNVKDSKYAELVFINQKTGKEIYMQERFACDETKTVSNAEDIEKIKINGVEAILSNGRNIDWEANGTIYYLAGKNIGKDEAIKVAESIK
jgi:hypothetical protein